MGFWDRVRGQAGAQFLDVIEWLDSSNDTIVYRFPIYDQAITDQSKLIVREGQAAVFISEGRLSDVFAPGTYTLDTANAPITSFFRTIKYAMNNPFKGEVYFISTRQFTNNGWGTQAPFLMRDADFGPVRVRAFGSFSYRVNDPATFMKEIVGTDGHFTTDEINGQLKKRLVSSFASTVGQAKIPLLDMVSSYDSFGEKVRDLLSPKFEADYGVAVTDLTIGNISVPKEVEEAIDQRSKMGALGNLDAYTKMKAADAIETAAANQGIGGAGMGMGVGFGLGNTVAGAMAGGAAGSPPPVSAPTYHYNGPDGQAQLSAADIVKKIAANRSASHMIWANGWPQWKAWTDVPEIANQLPPDVAAPPPAPGSARYHYNGPSGQSEKTAAEIAALVAADPDGKHHVWKAGFDAWKSPADVAEIAALMAAAPPPPPSDDGPPPPPQ